MIYSNDALRCGSKSCYELSIKKGKVCFPLIHPDMPNIMEDLFRSPKIILLVPIGAWLCFVTLSILTDTEGQLKDVQRVSSGALYGVAIIMAGILVTLSFQRLNKKWFCLMNPKIYGICSDLNLDCALLGNYTDVGRAAVFAIKGNLLCFEATIKKVLNQMYVCILFPTQ